MATEFTNTPLKWDNEGIEPPEELKTKGWEAGYKPPAEYFNYDMNNRYNVEKEIQEKLKAHADNTNNPHKVTKAQLGLGNVDNTSDINKPISTAVQTALNSKADDEHTHTLTDNNIMGVLPISKGGTGTSNPDIIDGCLLMGDNDFFAVSLQRPQVKSYLSTTNSFSPAWEQADTAPVQNSEKLITSGGVYRGINNSGMLNNVHRLKVTLDSNHIVASSFIPGYTFSSVEKLSTSEVFENGDIVFITFQKDSSFTESEEVSSRNMYINDDVFEGSFGVAGLYYKSLNDTQYSHMTIDITSGVVPVTVMFTLHKVTDGRFNLYAIL